MGLVAAGIVWMFDEGVSWPVAIAIAAVTNIAAAAVLGWWARHLVSEMPFTALLRQLRGEDPPPAVQTQTPAVQTPVVPAKP
jgi:uncharacterized membrane protein YqjE